MEKNLVTKARVRRAAGEMQASALVPGHAHRGSFERGESVHMTQV